VILPGRAGAEDDVVAAGGRGSAGEGGRGVIVRVAVGGRARGLEEAGVGRGRARRRRPVRAAAAVLSRRERLARAPARHRRRPRAPAAPRGDAQLRGARRVQVGGAPRGPAAAPVGGCHPRRDEHRHVESVHEADVVEVVPAGAAAGEREFRQGCWRRGAAAGALDGTRAAVGGGAREGARGGVGGAERARPDAARPRRGHGDRGRLPRGQREARGRRWWRAGVGEDARPHRVAAAVGDGESRGICSW